jgi:hypothetical protein
MFSLYKMLVALIAALFALFQSCVSYHHAVLSTRNHSWSVSSCICLHTGGEISIRNRFILVETRRILRLLACTSQCFIHFLLQCQTAIMMTHYQLEMLTDRQKTSIQYPLTCTLQELIVLSYLKLLGVLHALV